jgi:hypothetical protein
MQDNPNQRPSGREDKCLQRAVLALVLHEFPAQLTRDDLLYKGLGSADPINLAVENLANAGLLWCEGDVVLPTVAARHFEWLEDS